jgi:hypothetical protein
MVLSILYGGGVEGKLQWEKYCSGRDKNVGVLKYLHFVGYRR